MIMPVMMVKNFGSSVEFGRGLRNFSFFKPSTAADIHVYICSFLWRIEDVKKRKSASLSLRRNSKHI